MNNTVSWVLELNVRQGKLADLKALMAEMVTATRANEPNTTHYEWFLSADEKICHIYERYTDSAAVMTHLGAFGKHFATRFMGMLEPTRLTVYGNPNDEARKALAGMNAVVMGEVAGFAR